jgi:hypothetical protein
LTKKANTAIVKSMRNSKPKPISRGSQSFIIHSSLFIVNSAACGSLGPPPPPPPPHRNKKKIN